MKMLKILLLFICVVVCVELIMFNLLRKAFDETYGVDEAGF